MKISCLATLLFLITSAEPCSADVKDNIERTSFGSPFDASIKPSPAVTSPDDATDAFITYAGDVGADTNRYRIMIVRRRRMHLGRPEILFEHDFKDDGGVAGISMLRWTNASTLAALMVDRRGKPQIFDFGLDGTNRQLTHEDDSIVDFAADRDGNSLALMISHGARKAPATPSVYSGRVISSESPYELLEGREPLSNLKGYGGGNEVVLRTASGSTKIVLPDGEWPLADMGLSISPSGRYVVVPVGMLRSKIPPGWITQRTPSDLIFFYGLRIYDREKQQLRWLVDKPTLWENPSPMRWALDETALFVSALQSGDDEGPTPTAAVIDIATGREMDSIAGRLTSDGAGLGLADLRATSATHQLIRLVHRTGSWKFVSAKPTGTVVQVRQNFREPPRLVVHDLASGKDRLLFDPNPGLNLSTIEVREFRWTLDDGRQATAGLYLPRSFETGQRLPLVIQTHGWDPAQFWLDGPSTAGFAARTLAEDGFAVVQIGELPGGAPQGGEAAANARMIDRLVDALEAAGVADSKRLGITAWSATGLAVRVTLAFSSHHFGAAALIDSRDDGFFNYLLSNPSIQDLFDSEMGSKPYGDGLKDWQQNSPMFNLDRITTPVRLIALGPRVLSQWEQWASMKRLGRAVDFIWLPTSNHWPIRPSERMEVQQGTVDWFRYWLQGHVDPDPTKASQFDRWNALRAGQTETGQVVARRSQ